MKNYLLDTHTLLWYFGGNAELPKAARETISDLDNSIFVSIASIWEIAIKHSLGKLDLPRPFEELEPSIRNDGFELLPISVDELIVLDKLPFHHKDPFDRLLISQSIFHSFTMIGCDDIFDNYGVRRFWTSLK